MIRNFRHVVPLLVAVSLPVVPLCAQREVPRIDGLIQVHVVYENGRPVDSQLHADLTNETGIGLASQMTDSEGSVTFHVSGSSTYYVHVSGSAIQDATSQPIELGKLQDTGHGLQIIFIRVKPKTNSAEGATSTSSAANGQTTASAAELRVPQNARKDFDKGMDAWQKKDYQRAADEFEKAVAAYPQYDSAYNNLGVMYAQLNQTDKAMTAFKRSVELNDKNGDADRNLARMLIRQKDFPHAEELLKKCLTVQAPDASTLTMLAIAEIQDGKVDDALRDAQKVHGLPHEGYAVAHYVAGQALEDKHQDQQAAVEYNTYLRENPNGADAAQVKSALARLAGSTAAATPKSQ